MVNMIKKNLLLFMFIFLMIPIIQAPPDKTAVVSSNTNIQIITMPFEFVKQNTNLYVRFWAFNGSSGFILKNNTIYCTINLLQPQGLNILRSQIPLKNFGNTGNANGCLNCFWYDIDGGNLSNLGLYGLNLRCETYDNVTIGGDEMLPFIVTPLGDDLSTAQAIIYFIFLFMGIGLFILCLYYAIHIEWNHPRDEDGFILQVNDLKYVKIIMVVMCYLLVLFLAGLMRGITAYYLTTIGIYKFFEWIYWILLSLVYPVMVASMVLLLIAFLNNKKLHEALKKGIQV